MSHISFNYPPDVIARYTESDCLELALALQDKLGGDIYGICEHSKARLDSKCVFEPLHYVLRNQDVYVDIQGVWSEKALLEQWTNDVVSMSSHNLNYLYTLELAYLAWEESIDDYTILIADEIVHRLTLD